MTTTTLLEIDSSGIRQVILSQSTAQERREAMLFLAGKIEALDRLNRDLRVDCADTNATFVVKRSNGKLLRSGNNAPNSVHIFASRTFAEAVIEMSALQGCEVLTVEEAREAGLN